MTKAPDAFIAALLNGLNDARRDYGSQPIQLDTSGQYARHAEAQARISAQAGRPVHSAGLIDETTGELIPGSESVAMYAYNLEWLNGRGYGNQAAIHAPGLMSASHTVVGIAAIAYKSHVYVVFFSTPWMF